MSRLFVGIVQPFCVFRIVLYFFFWARAFCQSVLIVKAHCLYKLDSDANAPKTTPKENTKNLARDLAQTVGRVSHQVGK